MILCIDIGNSATKVARVVGREVRDRMSRPRDASDDQVARLLRRVARDGIDGAAVCSVRPQATAAVRNAVRRDLGVDPLIVTAKAALPIAIATRRPARVGTDRICAACGALPGRARDAIVIDAGSAITVDLVLDRRFLGGVIMAGPQVMLSGLHSYTAQLPDLRVRQGAGRFDDTAAAMLTGAELASAGAVLEAVRFLQRTAGRRPPVWLTGGHTGLLSPHLPPGWRREPDLTLIGLATIASPAP